MGFGKGMERATRVGSGLSLDVVAQPAADQRDIVDVASLKACREALDRVAIVAITDMRGRITEVNSLFCTISGYTPDELIGATHSLLNSGHHPRSFFDDLWKTISMAKVWRGEICNRAKCGQLYWVDTTIAPLRDNLGRLRGYVSIRFDISERKAAEERAQLELLRRQDSETLLAGLIHAEPDQVAMRDGNGRNSSDSQPSGRQ